MDDYGRRHMDVHGSSSHLKLEPVQFKTDMSKQCILQPADMFGWERTVDDEDWNVYWASVGTVRKIFSLESGFRLREDQIVNHFPNHYELTRKDLMVKNIKRYRKILERSGDPLGARDSNGNYKHLDFVPSTFALPVDYSLFEEEFKRHPKSKWIMKPTSRAQGVGIFIINKLNQIKKWAGSRWGTKEEPYIISRYIERPLLVGGKKFDLRLYILVTSYRPLRVYKFKQGFARFTNVKYSNDRDQMNNVEIHLTNVAIQKHMEGYNSKHGNKWNLENINTYIEGIYGQEKALECWRQIDDIVIHSLLAVQQNIINDKHCFECYGYDVIIDSNLKPWLIEVNASPSLSATTKADRIMKKKLITDVFSVVVPRDFPSTQTSRGMVGWNNATRVGDFELLYDELQINNDKEAQKRLPRTQVGGKSSKSYSSSRRNSDGGRGDSSTSGKSNRYGSRSKKSSGGGMWRC